METENPSPINEDQGSEKPAPFEKPDEDPPPVEDKQRTDVDDD